MISTLLAASPIILVLALMIFLRMGAHLAGPIGWALGLAIAAAAFGLSAQGLAISQAKGLLASIFVLAIIWPGLFLFHVVKDSGGIDAITRSMASAIEDRGLLLVVVAWCFSSAMEGVTGFGLPIAIVAPMLVALGVPPLRAVAAVAIGHSWSVTMGDMGVVFQALVSVSGMDAASLAPACAALLGFACLACGLGAAIVLGYRRLWPAVSAIALAMGAAQYLIAVYGPTALASLGAGLAGIGTGILIGRLTRARTVPAAPAAGARTASVAGARAPGLTLAFLGYLIVCALMALTIMVPRLRAALSSIALRIDFPAVASSDGFSTPAGPGQILRPLIHPGTMILIASLAACAIYRFRGLMPKGGWRHALAETGAAAWRVSVGMLFMVGISSIMDHAGMTLLLARGASGLLHKAYPLVSSLIGVLGAFATGSNTNSNFLFASLQKNAALMIGAKPSILLAAQTAGGSLGSMLAPAKLAIGCSTVGIKGGEGRVMRVTAAYGLAIALAVGAVALAVAYN